MGRARSAGGAVVMDPRLERVMSAVRDAVIAIQAAGKEASEASLVLKHLLRPGEPVSTGIENDEDDGIRIWLRQDGDIITFYSPDEALAVADRIRALALTVPIPEPELDEPT